jgi:serine/threonine protein kinase
MGDGRGRLIAGQYRLTERIGRGGFAVVWRARDERLAREVAAKEILFAPHFTEEQREELRERTRREARAAARIAHSGVITVYDAVVHDGSPWIIMEFVRGRSLNEIVRTDGPLPPERAALVGLRLLDALRVAHAAGVLHRDVKPGNVIIDGERVVLGDFGLATIEGDPDLTQPGIVMGAPAYTAPERARGEPAVAASDLWSLGATLFYAVEGSRAFEGPNANAVLHAVLTAEPARAPHAGPLAAVLDGLLRTDVAGRMGAAAAAELLTSITARAALPPQRRQGPGRPSRSRRLLPLRRRMPAGARGAVLGDDEIGQLPQ